MRKPRLIQLIITLVIIGAAVSYLNPPCHTVEERTLFTVRGTTNEVVFHNVCGADDEPAQARPQECRATWAGLWRRETVFTNVNCGLE